MKMSAILSSEGMCLIEMIPFSIAYKVNTDINIFCTCMKFVVFLQINGGVVVTMKGGWVPKSGSKFTKKSLEPKISLDA